MLNSFDGTFIAFEFNSSPKYDIESNAPENRT